MKTRLMLGLCALFLLSFGSSVEMYGQVPDYVPTDGLVALYLFDGNPNDSSGNENHGVNSGATLTTDRHGNENSAYSFSGNCNDRVDASIPQLTENQEFSLAFWAQRNGDGCLSPRMFEFWGGVRTMQGSWFNGWSHISFSGFPIVDVELEIDTWYHFALVNDGSEWKAYFNGTLNNVESNSDVVNSPDLAIGRMNHPSWDSFNGDIDEFVVWNRALLNEEILGLYNQNPNIAGCTDETACNFNPDANFNDASCIYLELNVPTVCDATGMLECSALVEGIDVANNSDVVGYDYLGSFENSRYFLSQQSFSPPAGWNQQEEFAQSMGGHLADIHSEEENSFIFNSILEAGWNESTWMGMTDAEEEGNWVWTSGQPVTYTNWSPNEPNNSSGGEHWMHM